MTEVAEVMIKRKLALGHLRMFRDSRGYEECIALLEKDIRTLSKKRAEDAEKLEEWQHLLRHPWHPLSDFERFRFTDPLRKNDFAENCLERLLRPSKTTDQR
jgi:hypothetical protein